MSDNTMVRPAPSQLTRRRLLVGLVAAVAATATGSRPVRTRAAPPYRDEDAFEIGDRVSVTAGLYLRTEPSLESEVLTTMPTDTICTVMSAPNPSHGYTWYLLDTPYGEGWAAGEFLELTTITYGHAPGTTLRVTDALWLRAEPGLGGEVLATMPTGTVVTVVAGPRSPAGAYNWYLLDTPYGRGWAAAPFLELVTGPGDHAPGTELQVTAGLWLRTAGTLNSEVRATMPTGTIVTVISGPNPADGYTWYELGTPYGWGWAAGEFLTTV